MPQFNNVPFNFVPLNHEVYIPEWGINISQDIPFEDGVNGFIRFEINNTTKMFIKDSIDNDDPESAHIVGSKKNYIPATSIKGMLRSVLEILSFAKMKSQDKNGKKFNHKVQGFDLAECIFGTIDGKYPLRGRVQIGNALCTREVNDNEKEPATGMLGQPKSSYYPYYLKQDSTKPVKTWNSKDIEIAGRKRYRIHSVNHVSQLPRGNDNSKMTKHLNLLPAGLTFNCEIRLHNIKPVELGALLSALTFHGNSDMCHHNIGMGKCRGFGRLEISNITLDLEANKKGVKVSDKLNDYMKVFELEMTKFIKGANSGNMTGWLNSKQVSMLLAIATDHTTPLEYMSLEEYKNNKNTTTGIFDVPYIGKSQLLIEDRIKALGLESQLDALKAKRKNLDGVVQSLNNTKTNYGALDDNSLRKELGNIERLKKDAQSIGFELNALICKFPDSIKREILSTYSFTEEKKNEIIGIADKKMNLIGDEQTQRKKIADSRKRVDELYSKGINAYMGKSSKFEDIMKKVVEWRKIEKIKGDNNFKFKKNFITFMIGIYDVQKLGNKDVSKFESKDKWDEALNNVITRRELDDILDKVITKYPERHPAAAEQPSAESSIQKDVEKQPKETRIFVGETTEISMPQDKENAEEPSGLLASLKKVLSKWF